MRSSGRNTIHEVAERAGVSNATVSNVLSGKGRASDAVAQRVRRAARDLGYETDRAASQLRSGRSRVIAALVPSLENPFFTELLAAFERHASAAGYDLIVASTNEDPDTEASRLATLLSWRPAGVFAIPCTDEFSGSRLLLAKAVPHVLADRLGDAASADAILADNVGAGHEAAAHLLSLGHRRLLVAASSLSLANVRERCAGIAEAAAAAGVPEPGILELGKSFDHAATRLSASIRARGRPDAIIALTNFATLGAISASSQLSLAIPRDIALVGFDDYAWMRACTPSITAVSQPVERMGTLAWRCLAERIAGLDAPPRVLRLPCQIALRGSALPKSRLSLREEPKPSAGPKGSPTLTNGRMQA